VPGRFTPVPQTSCLFTLWALLLLAVCPAAAQNATVHPLDPLTKEELQTTVTVLKTAGRATPQSRFLWVGLNEPPKSEILAYAPGKAVRREAFAVVYERESNRTFEAVVDLRNLRVLSWKAIPGVQPPMFGEDIELLSKLVHADTRWQAAMRRRGITDFNQVTVDPWAGEPGIKHRQLHAVSFLKGTDRNYYAHPIEGVVAYVDLNAKRVERVEDTGPIPVPRQSGEYEASRAGALRPEPKPLQIAQPDGPEFTVEGHEVRWQNWRFRFGFDPREGLVLYTVGFEDQGRLRSILYRASVSEMFVPYGDPGPNWRFRNAFDEGEFGLGAGAVPFAPGADAPANARYFSAAWVSEDGTVNETPDLIALYEQDGGLLWRHTDVTDLTTEARRARQLVLAGISNLGNYDYCFRWIFHQDGTLEQETLLSGIVQTQAFQPGQGAERAGGQPRYGALVAPDLAAVYHQHFFNFRLDMDVDGTENCVKEMNVESMKAGEDNPDGNAFTLRQTTLPSEKRARRALDPATNRCWCVVNCARPNALGQPVGYMLMCKYQKSAQTCLANRLTSGCGEGTSSCLMPGDNTVPFSLPNSPNRRRAGFLDAPFWATRYDPTQRYAAGNYPNQSRGDDGLPAWTQADRPLENEDVVLWYTMGVTHIPRPEDWPVMPVHRLGFKLVPRGFFDHNPTRDVPPAR
jgi:primary-amine oxidase